MRIAHASDIHIWHAKHTRATDFLNKRIVGGLNLLLHRHKAHNNALFAALCEDVNRQQIDHLVITGDWTHLSLPSEFAEALRLLQNVELSSSQITALAGNHDAYVAPLQKKHPFVQGFAPYFASDAPSEPPFPLLRIRGQMALIGVNTAVPTLPFFATGTLGKRQLESIETLLQQNQRLTRILALHHPPVSLPNDRWRKLTDRKALQRILQRTGCELVLHGHEHRDLLSWLPSSNGPIPVVGVGASTYDHPSLDRRARYNIYTIDNKRISCEIRVHDPAVGAFVTYKRFSLTSPKTQ